MAGRDLPEGYTYRMVDVDDLDERIVHIQEVNDMEKAKVRLFIILSIFAWMVSHRETDGAFAPQKIKSKSNKV